MRALLIAAVLLAGCDGAPRASVGDARPSVDQQRVEAEKACSSITGYRQGSSDRLRQQAYTDCVDAVSLKETETPEPGPALRGRKEGPA